LLLLGQARHRLGALGPLLLGLVLLSQPPPYQANSSRARV
jgi:hypothetical protein